MLGLEFNHVKGAITCSALTHIASCDCLNVSEVTLRDIGKTGSHENTTKREPCAYFSGVSSNLQYKVHQTPNVKRFPLRLEVVFAQSVEARMMM